MRIIAGDRRGLHFDVVKGNNTRPSTDKVREALFNALGQYFEGGESLDLFSGSGALSFEGLSRGIDHAVMIDRDFRAIQTIKENADKLRLNEYCEIHRMDYQQALKHVSRMGKQFRLVYLDPPYKNDYLITIIENLIALELLTPDAQVVVEHGPEVEVGQQYGKLTCVYDRTYSISTIKIFEFEDESNE
ncbi:MAG: 16S rRNA (guanine(966)-N(2))-methyltransferase RsmD [Culicoidibacterales bacterium]